MVNSINAKDTYQILKIDQCSVVLVDVPDFLTIGPNYGNLQIEISDQVKKKTKFTSPHAMYRFQECGSV